ncbi:MATE family efflux transporter [Mycetohabitans rhizoxinica]|uniref:MATE family efflux transporter n=1 Tax=Mycetohabitans rhizoxinica TaxID=412963 RepID=UPI0030CE509D
MTHIGTAQRTPARHHGKPTLAHHATETARLAAPLAIAQLSQMAMGVTDTILLGSLGPDALAAGGLGAALFFTTMTLLQGVLQSVSVTVAQARGAQAEHRVPSIYWTGLALSLALAVPAFVLLSFATPLLVAAGQPSALAEPVGQYARVLRWAALGSLIGIGMMRAFLPAIGAARRLLWVSVGGVALNGFLNYGLIQGAWGLPRMGFLGSAAATTITVWLTALVLLALLHLPERFRPFVAGSRRPRWSVMSELLSVGWPVAVTYGVETMLFLATSLAVGTLGAAALAAHQIALNVASITFMVPLAIAQAANVRVGYWAGARHPVEARRAGFVALALGGGFMAASGAVITWVPHGIIALYLNPQEPSNAATISLAASLLAVAAVFQIVDGLQTVGAGCLRGLRDTRVPMLLAATGYWGIGYPTGYWLTFHAGLGAKGLWWGLAAGLATVACLMVARFYWKSRALGRGPAA